MSDPFLSREAVVRRRTHRLAPSDTTLTDKLAQDRPYTTFQLGSMRYEAEAASESRVRTTDDGDDYLELYHSEWGLYGTGWNEALAVDDLLRRKIWLDDGSPPDMHGSYDDASHADRHRLARAQGQTYALPYWETQLLEQNDGEYTDPFTLTHLSAARGTLPIIWHGATADKEKVRIRYRGGTLRLYVDDRLAYKKQVRRWPDCRLDRKELLTEHWPAWATVISPLEDFDALPEGTFEEHQTRV
jgi:hypothetical protein